MIIQVRGWHGSGKSTLVRRLIAEHGGELVNQLNMPEFIRVSTRLNKKTGEYSLTRIRLQLRKLNGGLYVLGNYDLATGKGGGADKVSSDVGIEIMRHYASKIVAHPGLHMVWEGAWPSTRQATGEWLDVLREYGIVWATLDTTATQGLANITDGRNGGVSDPVAFERNYRYVQDHVEGAQIAGIRCETLHYVDGDDSAYNNLHALLVSGGWTCTSDQCTAFQQ